VGKQRLALWLGQLLLCSAAERDTAAHEAPEPCGLCEGCRYSASYSHPDLRWIFPRPRSKDADPAAADVARDYAEAIALRVNDGMLYAPADGSSGIYVATVRAIVREAQLTPAMGVRKVIVIGDAEHMVSQEGADQAANAFLKLLEEPPADTTVVMTTSEPDALLPTIRSRVVGIRVPRLPDADVAAWVGHDRTRAILDAAGVPSGDAERARRARGAPGALLTEASRGGAAAAARAIYEAAQAPNSAPRFRSALQQMATGARGGFADVLDELSEMLHSRARTAVDHGNPRAAAAACRAVLAVADAKVHVARNVHPQLIAAGLMRDLDARTHP
jgi:DNA polymerase-3 subunit delta'